MIKKTRTEQETFNPGKSIGLSFLFTMLFPLFSFAQESKLGNWYVYIGSKQINEKWNWHQEIQYRNYNLVGDLEQLLIRTGIGYNLTERNNNLLLGYGYIHSENYLPGSEEKTDTQEHRIFQQFITRQKFSGIALQHRYRFEQRFVESDFRMRLRYFLGLSIPITNVDLLPKTLYFSGYDEIFLNTEPNIFDRNRAYGGLGYIFSSSIKVEFGYMIQSFENSSRDQLNYFLYFNF